VRSLFRHRDFRLLLAGQSASTIGDRLVFVALALYVTDIGTPSDVGIVLACHAVPLVGFLLIGGVWADRLPRHLVVVTTDLIRFGLHALLATLIFTDAVEIWHIAAIEARFGTAEAFGAVEVLSVGCAIAFAALAAALTSREVRNLRSTAAAASR
jgi:Transmembrane secretion effector